MTSPESSFRAEEVMARLQGLGVSLWVDGERLRYRAPPGVVSGALLEALRQRRDQIIAIVRSEEIRPSGGVSEVRPSFAEERLWFLQQLAPESAQYNMSRALRLRGRLDEAALASAVAEVVRRHESLRSAFDERQGAPLRRVEPRVEVPVVVEDATSEPREAREDRARRVASEEASRPFDLSRAPLVRVRLLRLEATDHVLVFTMHHVVSDGWSVGVLIREVSALYAAYAAGRPSPLAPLPIQYADYVSWQRARLDGERLERRLGYWREQLDGAPWVLDVATDRTRPPVQGFRGATLARRLDGEARRAVRDVSRACGATEFMTLLAVYGIFLSRYSGQEDLVIGTPIANRTRPETEGLIGLFVNTLAFRIHVGEGARVDELIAEVRERTLGAHAYQDVPFEKIVEALGVARDPSRSPLVQVMFAFQNAPASELDMPGLQVSVWGDQGAVAKFDLTLTVTESGDGYELQWEYDTDLFEAATVERMAVQFEVLLRGALAGPERRAALLPMTTDAQRRKIVLDWNATDAPCARATLHGLFEEQAKRSPGAIALVAGAARLTYRELDERANAVARRLRAAGVGPEDIVAVMLERRAELLVALLGVLKSGAAYAPLDPAYPAERVKLVLEDSRAAVVLTEPALLEQVGHELRAGALFVTDERAPAPPAAPMSWRHRAYVIYTSGSTGRPKGVDIEHRSAVVFASWALRTFSRDELAGVLAATSVCFDLSVFELFVTLAAGGTVIMADNALALPTLAAREEVTLVNTVPSAMAELLRVGGLPLTVRTVNLAGEPLPSETVASLYALPHVQRVYNLYGPSEDTTYSTYDRATRGGWRPTIGRPIDNTRAYVLDARLEPVPPGVLGEVYLAGAGLARGYLNRPDLTAERFVPNPFADAWSGRLYRTGDVGRLRDDGQIEFLGRADHQVKVRGFRIELGEIESALRGCAAVRDAVALVREDEAGDKRVVAYVTGATDGESLRQELRARLPEYLIPSAIVVMSALPSTPNGKIDRRALPRPDRGLVSTTHVAPRTDIEGLVARLFSDVLGHAGVGIDDDFFVIGGHSLLATRVLSRLRATLAFDLPLRAVFEAPTVRRLSERVERALRARRDDGAPPLVAVSRTDRLPLSYSQQRLWFLDRLEPGNAAYNIAVALRLRGELHTDALRRAIGDVVRRHEALRTTFEVRDGDAAQIIHPPGDWSMPVVDVTADDERALVVERVIRDESCFSFDLARGPLFRTTLLRLASDEHLLLATMHHIVSDGWSIDVLAREIGASYAAYTSGRRPALPELPIQYADYASWQRHWLSGGALEEQLAYWRTQLAATEPLELPLDRPRPSTSTHRGAVVDLELPLALTRSLTRLSQAQGATLFMTLVAAFQVLLHRWTGQDDICVGTPIANRRRSEIEPLIGFFVNTLVLRADLSRRPTFLELLERTREAALGAYANQDAPFEKVVEILGAARSLNRSPVFQAMFALQNASPGALDLPGLDVEHVAIERRASHLDLTLSIGETPDGMRGVIEYDTDLFEAATVTRMATHFRALLDGIVADPARRIGELPLLSASERGALVAWSRAPLRIDHPASVVEAFAAQVSAAPDAVAVELAHESLTYAQLDQRTRDVAWRLRALGIGADSRVGLYMDRSIELVVGVLGVLRAGGAYVPMDPSLPAARRALLIESARVEVILTTRSSRQAAESLERRPGERLEVLTIALDEALGAPGAELPAVHPQSLAYVLYTSGSTGAPKGVMISHHAVVEHCAWMNALVPMSARADGAERGHAGARLLFQSASTFDGSVWEILGPLAFGGTVVVLPAASQGDAAAIARTIDERRVTAMALVPSVLAVLLDEPSLSGADLRHVLSGGEALTGDLARRALERFPRAELINVYGPTEATVDKAHLVCTPRDAARPVVSIGRPNAHARLYVLDREGDLAPTGVSGELYIGGPGLARGYVGGPDVTAGRFVPDPFSGESGARMYATGDRARFLPDGTLDFVGRVDRQVKLRGVRIEPGEIEAALVEHPSVRSAAVIVREDAPSDPSLAAYVVRAPGAAEPEANELRAHLKERLPAPMIPSSFTWLDVLPVTSSGKVDHRALPAPLATRRDRGDDFLAPATPLEHLVADAWTAVLGISTLDVRDDFFELGGHSLLATRVISQIRARSGLDVPLRALFEAPTVRDLAARLEETLGVAGARTLPPLERSTREGRLPLSYAQQRLWFLEELAPGTGTYNIPTALRLRGPLDTRALERAFGEVVRRHDALRTTFATRDGEATQVVHPHTGWTVPIVDCARADADALSRSIDREASLPFDLARGPLLRTTLIRVDDEEHVLLVTVHHIVSDGWSTDVLSREIGALYAAYANGLASPLPELEVQYADYAKWQRQWITGDVLDEQLAYWKAYLARATPLELPTDRPRGTVARHRGAHVPIALSSELTAAVKQFGREHGVTSFMTLLAVFEVLLHRYSGQDDVCVGTPIANRHRHEVEPLIGFFANTLVIRSDFSAHPTFASVLARVREDTLAAQAQQDAPFEKVVDALGVDRSLGRSPVFQVMFAHHDVPGSVLALPGLSVAPIDVSSMTSKFDLTLFLGEGGDGIRGALEYDTDLFDESTAARMVTRFEVLLRSALAAPETRVGRLSLTTEEERRRAAVSPVSPPAPDAEETVHALVARQAARTPNRLAVELEGAALTYRELEARSNRVARRLLAAGVGPEIRVGLHVKPSTDLWVGLLGILKAGGAYVPIDAALPRERVQAMMRQARCRWVVTQSPLREGLGGLHDIWTLCLDDPELESSSAEPVAGGATARNAAYVSCEVASARAPMMLVVEHGSIAALARDLWTPERAIEESAAPTGAVRSWVRLLNGLAVVAPEDVTLAADAVAALRREHRPDPADRAQTFVTDDSQSPLPAGLCGELCVAGPGVARGYLDDPARTAERFVPNPFAAGPGERMYRTGEIVRSTTDGALTFLDRRTDGRAKAGRYWIEPEAVEAALSSHSSVQGCAAVLREDAAGETHLVAYVMLRPDETFDEEALRDVVQEAMAGAAVPLTVVELSPLPLTRTGKVDRRALPRLDPSSTPDGVHVEARGEAERAFAEVWAQVLGIDGVSVEASFFQLGGDSILAIQMLARVGEAGWKVTPQQFFQDPTVAGLARVAERTEGAAHEHRAPVSGAAALTPLQRRLLDGSTPNPSHFNQAILLSAPDALDVSCLRGALKAVVAHHDALRLRFVTRDGAWTQEHGDVDDLFACADLGDVGDAELPAAIEARAASVQTGFDLARGGLFRMVWMTLGRGRGARLFLCAHHLVIDGVSWRVLLEDLERAYTQLAEGRPVTLGAKTTSFQRWGAELVEHAAGGARAELDFWRGQPWRDVRPLPRDGEGTNIAGDGRVVSVALDADETRGLLQRAPRAFGTQVDDVLVTALVQALAAWTGDRTSLIAMEGHGRGHLFDGVDVSRTVGWFTTMYPLVVQIEPRGDAREALKSVKRQLDAVPHKGIGFGALRALGSSDVAAPLSALPEPEVSFNYLGQLDQAFDASAILRPAAESVGPSEAASTPRWHLVEVGGSVLDGCLRVDFAYAATMHRRETIERLARDFVHRLRELVSLAGPAPSESSARRAGPRPAAAAASSPLVKLRTDGQKPPIFLFHGIGGSAQALHKLAERLGAERPVYGLQASGLIDGQASDSVDDMAARYLEAIRGVARSGPIQLCGWSMGGFVAFEVARRSMREGAQVASLAIVDVAVDDRKTDDPTELGAIRHFASHARLPELRLAHLEHEERIALVARRLGADVDYVARMVDLYQAHRRALNGYVPPSDYRGPLSLIRAADTVAQDAQRSLERDVTCGWGAVSSGVVEVQVVEGSHLSIMVEPHVGPLARAISRSLL